MPRRLINFRLSESELARLDSLVNLANIRENRKYAWQKLNRSDIIRNLIAVAHKEASTLEEAIGRKRKTSKP
jgi:hypothetical protein